MTPRGLRPADNPFAVQRLRRLAYVAPGGAPPNAALDALLTRLVALDHRAAIVGPEGHGKNTLLATLAARLTAAGWRVRHVQLRRGERRLPPPAVASLLAGVTRGDLLLVDGAEQLAMPAWLALRLRSRRAGGLVVTSHRAGLLPTLVDCTTSPALLAGLVSELLDHRSAPVALPPLPAAEELWALYGGNLRDALLHLYDHCAGCLPAPRTLP
jgi:hypothetical protein